MSGTSVLDEPPAPAPTATGLRPLRLAFAGGGTGGHIVPGLHILAAAREAGVAPPDLVWFTSGRPVEDRVLAKLEERAGPVPCERVVLSVEPEGGGAPSRVGLIFKLPSSYGQALAALKRHRPQVLVGLGGFTSLPAVLAARRLGIPVALLEINAHAGSATTWLSRFATRVLHAWKATMPAAAGPRHAHVGPPLAPDFAPDPHGVAAARAELGFDPDAPLFVVLGGSQGSSALNRFVREHAPALARAGVQVLHQTGPKKLAEGAEPFSGYRKLEYIDPVRPALAAATVVLCRGGASTLAEVAAMRVPCFVAPYPHHADRHQERNARELGEGMRLVQDEALDASFRDELAHLLSDEGRAERESMQAALARAMPHGSSLRVLAELAAIAREA
jgi:UDP-N-acetylglucosamine--N-acetylmuramyl-(pentapeptide) pyrophosphoryl-undecaprenol N-acetylglucosamine transferase